MNQPASSWLELLGVLASLIALVPGGHLRMRSLQLLLRHSFDRRDDTFLVRWDSDCCRDLQWWLNRSCLEKEISLSQVSPNLDFRSDASDVGWGANLGDSVVFDLWLLRRQVSPSMSESCWPWRKVCIISLHS